MHTCVQQLRHRALPACSLCIGVLEAHLGFGVRPTLLALSLTSHLAHNLSGLGLM